MLGDSTWDCIAAAAAASRLSRCSPAGSPEQELRAAEAVCVFESIGELIERLDETPLAGG